MNDADWLADDVPLARRVQLHGTVRGDEPVARLILTDPVGEAREVDLTEKVALDLLVQLGLFLQQIRAG